MIRPACERLIEKFLAVLLASADMTTIMSYARSCASLTRE